MYMATTLLEIPENSWNLTFVLEIPGKSWNFNIFLKMSWNFGKIFTKKFLFINERIISWLHFISSILSIFCHSILSKENSDLKLNIFVFDLSSYRSCYNQGIFHWKSGITWESHRQNWNGWGQFWKNRTLCWNLV